jgi:acetyltransferase-like isoleucine patch superfamily enzyme
LSTIKALLKFHYIRLELLNNLYTKMKDIIKKLFQLWQHFRFRKKAIIHPTAIIHQSAKFFNPQGKRENINIGAYSNVRGELLLYGHGGKIIIGEYCYIGEGTRIWSSGNIQVGNRVLISHNVNIHDSNSHPLNSKERHEHFLEIIFNGHPKQLFLNEKDVVIKDDVWIGFNSSVLKGVTIGSNSVIASCSTIIKSVDSNTMVGGNPATILKKIE